MNYIHPIKLNYTSIYFVLIVAMLFVSSNLKNSSITQAASLTSSNDLTGQFSENMTEFSSTENANFLIETDLGIQNNGDISNLSGQNRVSNNTIAGDISTGSSVIGLGLSNNNVSNSGPFPLNQNTSLANINSSLTATGSESRNANNANTTRNLSYEISDNESITNNFNIQSTSGQNDTSLNTIVGDIETGDILVSINAINGEADRPTENGEVLSPPSPNNGEVVPPEIITPPIQPEVPSDGRGGGAVIEEVIAEEMPVPKKEAEFFPSGSQSPLFYLLMLSLSLIGLFIDKTKPFSDIFPNLIFAGRCMQRLNYPALHVKQTWIDNK